MLLLLLLLLLLCSSSFQYIRISNYIFFCYRLAITVLGVTISSTIFVRATNCDIRTCACEHACLISICVHTLDRTPCRMWSEQKEKDETEAAKKSTANWAIEQIDIENRTDRYNPKYFQYDNMKYEMIILLFDEHAYQRMLNDLNASLFIFFRLFHFHRLRYSNVWFLTLCNVSVNIQRMCKSFLDNCFDGTERARHRKNEAIEALSYLSVDEVSFETNVF